MTLKRRATMGKIFLASGLLVKAVFIILAMLGVGFATGYTGALIPTCIIVGGLAVFAFERQGITGILAGICAVLWLVSVSMTVVSAAFSLFIYFASFILFAIMLITMRRRFWRYILVIFVLASTVLTILHTTAVVPMKETGITVMLALTHIAMAAGLFI